MEYNFETFKREIDLIIRQNPLECELYSIIASILRSCNYSSDISIRDVTKLSKKSRVTDPQTRLYKMRDNTYGASDFLFIDTKYRYSEKKKEYILGCCEIKALNYGIKDLDKSINGDKQFDGELRTFRKLLCTNGIQWLYYEQEKYEKTKEPSWRKELGKYYLRGKYVSDKDYVVWNSDEHWDDLLKKLNDMLKKMKSE